MGEVNHTTEYVTDLFNFVDVEWTILLSNSIFCLGDTHSLYATLLRCCVVPEVLEVHVVPSEEVRMVPQTPTATKVLFP